MKTILILLLASLVSCSSPFANDDDQFAIGQAQAMLMQAENHTRASAAMAGQPRPFRLQPLVPLQPIR